MGVHQKMLQVTSQYSNEAYDYPANIKESFGDLGRTVSEKVHLLSSATTPAEAQAALTAPPSAKPQPKTFNHAIARASWQAASCSNNNTLVLEKTLLLPPLRSTPWPVSVSVKPDLPKTPKFRADSSQAEAQLSTPTLC